MSSSHQSATAFQAGAPLTLSSNQSPACRRPACSRTPAAASWSMTAVMPSKPSNIRRSPTTKTQPAPVIEHEDQLLEYQLFLQSCSPEDRMAMTKAPVYKTADGALVCHWSPAISQAYEIAADYERFLASPDASDIDRTAPVFLAPTGGLICPYPKHQQQ